MGHIQSKVCHVYSVPAEARRGPQITLAWSYVVSWVLGIELVTVGEQLVLLTAQSCLQLQILFLVVCVMCVQCGLVHTSAMPMEVGRVSISGNWRPFVRAGEPEALILVLPNSATS